MGIQVGGIYVYTSHMALARQCQGSLLLLVSKDPFLDFVRNGVCWLVRWFCVLSCLVGLILTSIFSPG